MLTFTIRRLLLSIPTLLFISLVIFLLLQLAPGDPMAQVPLTVPPEVKQKMREALGLGQPIYVQYYKWLIQFFWVEPQVFIDWATRDSFLPGWLVVDHGLFSAAKPTTRSRMAMGGRADEARAAGCAGYGYAMTEGGHCPLDRWLSPAK